VRTSLPGTRPASVAHQKGLGLPHLTEGRRHPCLDTYKQLVRVTSARRATPGNGAPEEGRGISQRLAVIPLRGKGAPRAPAARVRDLPKRLEVWRGRQIWRGRVGAAPRAPGRVRLHDGGPRHSHTRMLCHIQTAPASSTPTPWILRSCLCTHFLRSTLCARQPLHTQHTHYSRIQCSVSLATRSAGDHSAAHLRLLMPVAGSQHSPRDKAAFSLPGTYQAGAGLSKHCACQPQTVPMPLQHPASHCASRVPAAAVRRTLTRSPGMCTVDAPSSPAFASCAPPLASATGLSGALSPPPPALPSADPPSAAPAAAAAPTTPPGVRRPSSSAPWPGPRCTTPLAPPAGGCGCAPACRAAAVRSGAPPARPAAGCGAPAGGAGAAGGCRPRARLRGGAAAPGTALGATAGLPAPHSSSLHIAVAAPESMQSSAVPWCLPAPWRRTLLLACITQHTLVQCKKSQTVGTDSTAQTRYRTWDLRLPNGRVRTWDI